MAVFHSKSEAETEAIGAEFARELPGGTVVAMYGDLGAGKTAFVRGMARGMGLDCRVSSPTFTIVQVYEEGRMPFYHFDVYRIGDISEMDEIGYEDYFYGEGVSLVEWANLIEELLPPSYTEITIEKDVTKGFEYRKITIDKNEG